MKTSTRSPRRMSCRSSPLAVAQSKERYSKCIGEARLMVGNCIRMMCRSPKSRAGCHFAAAIGLRSMLEDFAPTIPDYALDMHTIEGQGDGPWSRSFPQRGREAGPAADRAGSLRGRSLSAVGDQAAEQVSSTATDCRHAIRHPSSVSVAPMILPCDTNSRQFASRAGRDAGTGRELE